MQTFSTGPCENVEATVPLRIPFILVQPYARSLQDRAANLVSEAAAATRKLGRAASPMPKSGPTRILYVKSNQEPSGARPRRQSGRAPAGTVSARPSSAITGLNLFLPGCTNTESDFNHTCRGDPLLGSRRDVDQRVFNRMKKS